MEQQLGTVLIERDRRTLRLTPSGERLAAYAKRLLALNEEAWQQVREAHDGGKLSVRIGAGVGTALVTLPQPLAAFQRRHPRIGVRVKTERVERLIEELLAGGLDLILVTVDDVPAGVRAVPLYDEVLVLVGHAEYWLSRRPQPIDAADLNGVPLIAFSREVGHRKYLDRILAQAGIKPDIIMELDNAALLLKYVEICTGVAFVPLSALKNIPPHAPLNMIQVSGLPRLTRRKYMLIRDEPDVPYAVRALFEYLARYPWNAMWHDAAP